MHRYATPALLLASFRRWDAVAAGGSAIIALTLPQKTDLSTSTGDDSEGFFPLSMALTSAMRLAVDDINAGGVDSLTGGNLTLSVFGVNAGREMEGLCDALEAVGKNGTFGVSEPLLQNLVVFLTLTRIIKSVVTAQAPLTLELRNTPRKKHKPYRKM